jgi:hypothetical protein
MIDVSNEIFNAVATDLRSAYEGIKVVGEYVSSPTHFPTVTIDEIGNVPTHLDSASSNKYARVTYRVQVFSNLKSARASFMLIPQEKSPQMTSVSSSLRHSRPLRSFCR